jgi:excisionase family DNA binding protein
MPVCTLGDNDLDALDIATICQRSKVGRSFVYEEIRAGRLAAVKLGRLTRVLKADYEAWLAASPYVSPSSQIDPTPRPALEPASVARKVAAARAGGGAR